MKGIFNLSDIRWSPFRGYDSPLAWPATAVLGLLLLTAVQLAAALHPVNVLTSRADAMQWNIAACSACQRLYQQCSICADAMQSLYRCYMASNNVERDCKLQCSSQYKLPIHVVYKT